MINLIVSGICMVVLVSGCGWNGTPTRSNDFTPVTSIGIVAASSTIAKLTSTTLSVQGNSAGLPARDVTAQAVWSSSAPDVAGFVTAASPNRVTGLAPGTAILTATVGSVSATFTVTVSPATISTLTISPATPAIFKGLTTQLTVNGSFSDGTTQNLTFDAAWASDSPGVATVGNVAASKGFVQTVATGTSTISATFGGASGTTLLTVKEAVLQSITVTPLNPSILTLSSGTFKAAGNYSDGTKSDITAQVAWSSSDSAIAAVDGSGAVTTLLQGAATITASLNGVHGTTSLKVTGGNLNANGIVISPLTSKLVKDTSGFITAKGTFSNGSIRDITGAVEWSVANSTAETATAGGNLELLKALAVTPATTITAKYGAVTATASLTVVAPQLVSIAFFTTSLDLAVGTSSPLIVNASFNDGTIQDVTALSTWTSNNVATATVGTSGHAAGRVTGVASGTTTVSATYGGKTVPIPATVTVTKRVIQSLSITGSSNITAGNQVAFTAVATYSDGSSRNVTEADGTIWSIDNPNVAIFADSVNQPGQIVGVDIGTAVLTATFDGKSQAAKITVQ